MIVAISSSIRLCGRLLTVYSMLCNKATFLLLCISVNCCCVGCVGCIAAAFWRLCRGWDNINSNIAIIISYGDKITRTIILFTTVKGISLGITQLAS